MNNDVCGIDELDPGTLMRVEVDGRALCLARTLDGTVYALSDKCSHEDAPLSDGELVDFEVECPWHVSRFDLTTGLPTCEPAVDPVQTFATTISEGRVLVDLADRDS